MNSNVMNDKQLLINMLLKAGYTSVTVDTDQYIGTQIAAKEFAFTKMELAIANGDGYSNLHTVFAFNSDGSLKGHGIW